MSLLNQLLLILLLLETLDMLKEMHLVVLKISLDILQEWKEELVAYTKELRLSLLDLPYLKWFLTILVMGMVFYFQPSLMKGR